MVFDPKSSGIHSQSRAQVDSYRCKLTINVHGVLRLKTSAGGSNSSCTSFAGWGPLASTRTCCCSSLFFLSFSCFMFFMVFKSAVLLLSVQFIKFYSSSLYTWTMSSCISVMHVSKTNLLQDDKSMAYPISYLLADKTILIFYFYFQTLPEWSTCPRSSTSHGNCQASSAARWTPTLLWHQWSGRKTDTLLGWRRSVCRTFQDEPMANRWVVDVPLYCHESSLLRVIFLRVVWFYFCLAVPWLELDARWKYPGGRGHRRLLGHLHLCALQCPGYHGHVSTCYFGAKGTQLPTMATVAV